MIKVEMRKNEETGVTSFGFECNNASDHETLDALRVALIGDHPRRGGYVNSNRLVIDVRVPETKALS